jgi:GNAT superfamily N-acetyltransferase
VGGAVVGFLALRLQGEDAAEIHVMGVLPEQQRRGIGRQLVAQCEQFCLARGIFLLTVKTLADTHPSPSYAKTRAFYASLGFVPQRITDEWGSGQPCLHMAKALEGEGIV